jgi:hypothetical protein
MLHRVPTYLGKLTERNVLLLAHLFVSKFDGTTCSPTIPLKHVLYEAYRRVPIVGIELTAISACETS